MKKKRINIIAAVILSLLFIIGCGGGGGGDSKKVIAEPKINLPESSSHDFGNIVLNNYAEKEFIVTNVGTYDGLVISGISQPASPFSITSDTCTGKSLIKGASCSFIVRFAPTAAVNFSDTITVTSNDPPARTITLTGVGQDLNVWINQLTYSGDCPTRTITVDVTVTNPNGVLNPDPLDLGNFTLWHNGVQLIPWTIPGTEFVSIVEKDPDPMTVVLALDLSASLGASPYPANIKSAAVDFVQLFLPPRSTTLDQAAIFKFKDNYISYPATDFRAAQANNTDLVEYINGTDGESSLIQGTALYEVLYASIDRAKTGTNPKKAVIILSDGVDDPQHTESYSKQDVIDYANADPKVSIFTIFYVDPDYYEDASPAILQDLSIGSGGQYYNSGSGTSYELSGIFGQIFSVLGAKYIITYTPSSNCSGTQIPVKVQVTSGDTPALTGSDTKKIDLP